MPDAVLEANDSTVLPLLADPTSYRACLWDLREPGEQRDYWLDLFRRHFPSLLDEARREAAGRGEDAADVERRCVAAAAEFAAHLDWAASEAAMRGPDRLDVLTICWARERALRNHAFADPYRLAKAEQNAAMLPLLPGVLAELDAMPERQRHEAIVRGIFAGNIYDQGATETNAMFAGGKSVDFHDVRLKLKPRPWLCDDLDAWLDRMKGNPHRRAVVFVDNAGPDIVLGMLPFCRELARRGTRVVMAANSAPSLNDVTAGEVDVLLDQAARLDPLLRGACDDGRLMVLPSGNWAPLIDLTMVSASLVADLAEDPPDLVVLEGMGRGIESNFDAEFSCESINVAMVKDRGVAMGIGGELYDLVFRYRA